MVQVLYVPYWMEVKLSHTIVTWKGDESFTLFGATVFKSVQLCTLLSDLEWMFGLSGVGL